MVEQYRSPLWAVDAPWECSRCAEDMPCPNPVAYDLSREWVCDDCAEDIIAENGQFGAGA